MIKISAPGKIIIIGEHAVVYGQPAIIAAIGLRCFVEAEKSSTVTIKGMGIHETSSVKEAIAFSEEIESLWAECYGKKDFSPLFKKIKGKFLLSAVGKVLRDLSIEGGITIKVDAEVPIGAGLGSSAALAVSVVKAIAEAHGKKISTEKVNEIAFRLEQFSHGTPSGGDNTACCYGGLVWFQRAEPNIIKHLKEEIPHNVEHFYIVNTEKPKIGTGQLVQKVRNLPDSYRTPRVKALGMLTYEMRAALANKNSKKIKEAMNRAQEILAELGVSTKEIDEICQAAQSIGGAGKLCGAGGGGVVLCYHEDESKLRKAVSGIGYKIEKVELGAQGVRRE